MASRRATMIGASREWAPAHDQMMSTVPAFVRNFRLADAPDAVVHQAKRCLLDLTGVAAAGSRLPVGAIARRIAAAQFGGTEARFLFAGGSASASGAALVNASVIDGFDAHDGHPLTKGHPGCGSLAALLAFAGEGEGLSGEAALGHLVLGYEVAVRAGIALHATAPDYHTTGAWVAIAAAAIGGRMMGFDDGRLREAIGIAEYYGPRSQMMRCIDHPTMVKDGSGWGAMAGVLAAHLAREGYTGAPAVTVEAAEARHLWDDLGSRWRMLELYFKPYPVCRWAQPAMEAAAALKRAHAFEADDVEAITVRTFHEASRLATAAPLSTDAAQYSLPFPVAALLARGHVGPSDIDGAALSDPVLLRLAGAIRLVDDPAYSARFPAERWADVEIGLKDGRKLRSEPAVARGSAENPLTDAEISAKFHGLMQSSGFGERAAAIERMVLSLDRAKSFAPLLDLMTGPAPMETLETAQ